MPKIRIDVNKLERATADYISLVSRGANRLPFRIIKQHPENSMIDLGGKLDLSDIASVLKSDGGVKLTKGERVVQADKPALLSPTPVALAAIVVEKGEYLTDEVKQELADAGIATDKVTENDDGTLLFAQTDDLDDVTVAKMSGDTLALVANLNVERLLKNTNVAATYDEIGFLPSPAELKDGMTATVQKIEQDEALPLAERHKKVAAETAAATAFVSTLIEALPEQAFKADEIIARAKKAFPFKKKPEAAPAAAPAAQPPSNAASSGAPPEPQAQATPDASPKPAAQAPEPPHPAAAEGAEGAEAPDSDETAPEGVDADAWGQMTPEEKAKVKAAAASAASGQPAMKTDQSQEGKPTATIPPMEEQVQKTLAAMMDTLGKVNESLGELSRKHDALAEKVAGVEAKAIKTEKAVTTTVIGGAPQDDRQPVSAKKQEKPLGAFDTAFDKSVRTQKSFIERQMGARQQRR